MSDRTSLLVHGHDVVGLPVVTLAGEDIAQVKDVLFDRDGRVEGFTLAGRRLLSGPLKQWLPWANVHGFGPDAVMVTAEAAMVEGTGTAVDGDVLGGEVLTRSGQAVGEVVDVILRLEPYGLDVVGYEVDPAGGSGNRFVPLPDTLAVNVGRIVVPDQAVEFLSHDLSGFAASVDSFRQRLAGEQQ